MAEYLVSDSHIPSFTSIVSHFVAGVSFDELRIEVVDKVKLCLIDWLGLAIRGSKEPLAGILHQLLKEGNLSGSIPIVGTGFTTNEYFAALINGAQGHAIDFDDTHEPSLVHVSASLWPAILAVAHARGMTGKEVVAAYVAGAEVQGITGRDVGRQLTSRGFHATSILGHLGAAASLSNLLGLSEEKTEFAIGISATESGGLGASFGTMSKPLHPGKAAMDGILAVMLAEGGFTGALDSVSGSDGLLGTLLGSVPTMSFPEGYRVGDTVMEVGIKPYPSCLLTHPSIDAAISLSKRLREPIDEIARIDCYVNPLAIQVAGKSSPRSGLEGKFSIQFCVASALLQSRLADSDFSEVRIDDPSVARISSKISLVSDEALSVKQSTIRLTYRSGKSDECHVEIAKGDPSNPMEPAECFQKFLDLSEPTIGPAAAKKLLDECLRLEELEGVQLLGS